MAASAKKNLCSNYDIEIFQTDIRNKIYKSAQVSFY